MQLSTFQNGFSAALLSPAVDAPWLSALESQPGFAVYRNTVLKGCIDALQGNYPTVCQVTIPRQSRGHSGCEPLKAAVRGR